MSRPREAGIGVEDIVDLVAIEHADAGRLLDAEAAGAEVIHPRAGLDLFRRKRDGVVVVEIGIAGGQPVKSPAHPRLEGVELL